MRCAVFGLSLFVFAAGWAHGAQTIVTVAGGGQVRGEGLATAVSLAQPSGLALDAAGNMFIADTDNHRICRVDGASGMLTVLAGSGVDGFADGAAGEAQFSVPSDVAVDAAGNVYVADSFNALIRKFDAATRAVTTYAGGGASNDDGLALLDFEFDFPVGITLDGAGTKLYVCDAGNGTIFTIDMAAASVRRLAGTLNSGFSGDGGPAVNAQFNEPRRLTLDAAGNFIVCDTLNHRVRRIDAASGIVTTLAGTGVDEFSGDGGPATAAELNFPTAVAVDSAGNILFLDADNYRLRRVDAAGVITTVAGAGFDGFGGDGRDPLQSFLLFPLGLLRSGTGEILIADTFNNRVRKIGNDLTSPGDSDSDGFPNHVEAVGLSDPQSAASTPFSNNPVAGIDGHGLRRLSAKFDFARTSRDSIQLSGILPIPEGVSVPLQLVLLDVGGQAFAFNLDAKGKSPKGNNTFKLNIKPRDGDSSYTCKLAKGSFLNGLGDENVLSETAKNRSLAVPVTIYFAGRIYSNTAFSSYTATAGKSGSLRTGGSAFVPGSAGAVRLPGRGQRE